MTLNFPANPANEDIFLGYIYDATEGVWNANPRQLASRFVTSATTPAEPSNGDGWFNTTNGKTYIFYYDGTSGQWVESGYPVLGYQTLSNLSDTNIVSPVVDEALVYDGTNWVNGAAGGGLVAVKSALRDTIFDASVTAGNNVAVPGLEIVHEVADPANRLIISAFFGAAGNSQGRGQVGIAVHDGTGLINVAASPGSRTAVTAGGTVAATSSGELVAMPSVTFVHTPGAGSKTYTVRAINVHNATETLFINRSQSDVDNLARPRAVSSLVIQEVAV